MWISSISDHVHLGCVWDPQLVDSSNHDLSYVQQLPGKIDDCCVEDHQKQKEKCSVWE